MEFEEAYQQFEKTTEKVVGQNSGLTVESVQDFANALRTLLSLSEVSEDFLSAQEQEILERISAISGKYVDENFLDEVAPFAFRMRRHIFSAKKPRS